MRPSEITVIVGERRAIDHPVKRGGKQGWVVTIVWSFLSKPFRSAVDEHTEAQNGVDGAIVDRYALRELLEITQPTGCREAEAVIAFITRGKKCFIEQ